MGLAGQTNHMCTQALSCLSTLAPLCVEDYMTCQGNTRLLMLIEWCTKDDGKLLVCMSAQTLAWFTTSIFMCAESFKGHGNSFHGEGGCGTKISQLRYSLRLLLSMCSTGDDAIHHDLHEQGAIPLFLGEIENVVLCTYMYNSLVPSLFLRVS